MPETDAAVAMETGYPDDLPECVSLKTTNMAVLIVGSRPEPEMEQPSTKPGEDMEVIDLNSLRDLLAGINEIER